MTDETLIAELTERVRRLEAEVARLEKALGTTRLEKEVAENMYQNCMQEKVQLETPETGTLRRFWAAIGGASGKVYEVGIGDSPPAMLPPCSNQDLPSWVEFVEVRREP